MGATAPRLKAEPGSSPETEAPLDLRGLAGPLLRLIASRWRLLVPCVCVGAVAAFAAAEIRDTSSYRATAVLQLHDNPLVYHVPPLALHRVKDAGGMPYQVKLAYGAAQAPAAKALGISTEALRSAVTVRAVGNRLIFTTELRGRERARDTVAALAASYRAVRERLFVYAATQARAQLLRTSRTAATAHQRADARAEAGYAETILRDKASITRARTASLEPLQSSSRRPVAESAFLGAAAGAVAWLVVVIVLAMAAAGSAEPPPFAGWRRRPASTRGGMA